MKQDFPSVLPSTPTLAWLDHLPGHHMDCARDLVEDLLAQAQKHTEAAQQLRDQAARACASTLRLATSFWTPRAIAAALAHVARHTPKDVTYIPAPEVTHHAAL